MVHAYQNFTASDARLLIVTAPAGFCDVFVELSTAAPDGIPAPHRFAALDATYGLTTLGPPTSP